MSTNDYLNVKMKVNVCPDRSINKNTFFLLISYCFCSEPVISFYVDFSELGTEDRTSLKTR